MLVALSLVSSGSPTVSARPIQEAPANPGIRFTQQPRRNLLRITAPGYELTLSRVNGAIVSLVDRAARARLLAGEGGCMWGARADGSAARGTVDGTIQNGRFLFTCGGPLPGIPAPTYRISTG